MPRSGHFGGWLVSLAALGLTLGEPTVSAEDKGLASPVLSLSLEQSARPFGEFAAIRSSAPLTQIPAQNLTLRSPTDKFRLDASPLFDDFVNVVRNTGIPLRAIADQDGEHTIGVSASFHVGERLPTVAFRAGQSLPDAFGAFAASRSLSWALTWPVGRFTLQMEGGSRSDFGYFAIAGIQWSSPSRPLAVGIGVPLKPQNVRGPVGVLMQFRVKW